MGPREMAQWLKMSTAFSEDPNLVLIPAVITIPEDLIHFLASLSICTHMWYTQTIFKNKNESLKKINLLIRVPKNFPNHFLPVEIKFDTFWYTKVNNAVFKCS